MVSRRLCAGAGMLTAAFLGLSTTTANAWWPIAHYELAMKAVGAEIARYAQLPDYTNSWAPTWTGTTTAWLPLFGGRVRYLFCWSHAVQDAGEHTESLLYIAVPNVPMYPNDGRYPGTKMWNLVRRKMLLTGYSAQDIHVMELAAKGFRAHNAADGGFVDAESPDGPGKAHFDFFLGGSINAWSIEHRVKEKWADYMVFIYNRYHGDTSMAFVPDPLDPSHPGALDLLHIKQGGVKIVDPEAEYAAGIPVVGNNWPQQDNLLPAVTLMSLEQKAFRKNRRSMHLSVAVEKLEVQPPAEICAQYIDNCVIPCSHSSVSGSYTWDSTWDGFYYCCLVATDPAYQWPSVEELMTDRFPKTASVISEWVNALPN